MDKMTKQDGASLDVVADNLEKLKTFFPDAFTEGTEGKTAIDFEVLRQLLGDVVEEGEEKYGLNWYGKKRARQIALTPSLGTLRPCPEESVDWDTTQNLFIEGDNLEVLKLLQKSYANKVKVIYIDPPYNTGKEFIYPDKFQDNMDTYLKYTGQKDDEGITTTSNSESSGRYHTNWLNMMYSRLKSARNLLKEEGVIVVHIDEHEYPNLEKLLNEIFGEENNLGTVVWDKRNPKGEVVGIAQQHESVLFFCKNKHLFKNKVCFKRKKENAEKMLKKVSQLISIKGAVTDNVRKKYKEWLKKQAFSGGDKAYSLIDDEGNIYRPVSMAAPDRPETRSHRPLIHPVTKKACPVPKKGWRFPDSSMDGLLLNNEILFGQDETTQPNRKYLLKENLYENVSSLLYYGGSDDSLFKEMKLSFSNPKVVSVSKKLIAPVTTISESDIVLDFFSGSCTTAHTILDLNKEDDGNRKFIMVQLPEPCEGKSDAYKAGYETIAEIGKERIRRAAAKIKEENPNHEGDLGFKVFKLDSSNIKAWNPDRADLEQTLLDHAEHLVEGRTEQDVLYELLLKRGVELTVPIEEKEFSGKKVYSIGYGVLFACLSESIEEDEVEVLAQGIIDWKAELEPETDSQVVFRDSAFSDDITKTNLAEILKQNGIAHVRSL